MTPIPSPPEESTPRQAAHRLYQLCDELERRELQSRGDGLPKTESLGWSIRIWCCTSTNRKSF